jgi:probable rRNA maturation factor
MIELQVAVDSENVPAELQFQRWAETVARACSNENKSLTIRVTDEAEGAELNLRYRQKQGPTNVLSFPFEDPPGVETNMLGDLAICAPVVVREATQQNKSSEAHWAHMTVHGVLHLCGYDHLESQQAKCMEELEVKILEELGFLSPYEDKQY